MFPLDKNAYKFQVSWRFHLCLRLLEGPRIGKMRPKDLEALHPKKGNRVLPNRQKKNVFEYANDKQLALKLNLHL